MLLLFMDAKHDTRSYLVPLANLTRIAAESADVLEIVSDQSPSKRPRPTKPTSHLRVYERYTHNAAVGTITEDWYFDQQTYLPLYAEAHQALTTYPQRCTETYLSFTNYSQKAGVLTPTVVNTSFFRLEGYGRILHTITDLLPADPQVVIRLGGGND